MSAQPPQSPAAIRKPVTLPRLREMRQRGEPVAMLTCYDASFARLADEAGLDVLLVGDSLGMVLQGHRNTAPVTLEDVAYHTACVARAQPAAWLVADLPLGTYEESPEVALRSSQVLLRAGAQMVKLEGGGWTADTVRFLVDRGVPVCAHLGLTPQRVHALGGYRIQGRDEASAQALSADARSLAEAGAALLVLELVPSPLGRRVTDDNPGLLTIGIGAGCGTAGQVLVLHDMLGITPGKMPRFVRNFMEGSASVGEALSRYVADVKARRFPDDALHGY